jgi:hypothetical protein
LLSDSRRKQQKGFPVHPFHPSAVLIPELERFVVCERDLLGFAIAWEAELSAHQRQKILPSQQTLHFIRMPPPVLPGIYSLVAIVA